jgi:serine/threonine-protein kinase
MTALIGQSLDHYRLIEQIGQGGMATVYRAEDTRSGIDVALKVLSPTITGNRRFVKRFRREAEMAKQRLNHPNVVPVIAYGEVSGYIYLVMPYVQGETLSAKLTSQSISTEQAGSWIGQVAEALSHAHREGIIHRDIKPSNIMITPEGKALLTDFGLARVVEGSSTLTGSMLMGTPAYVSPEQGRGEKLDHKSDQYSLGVVLYQIATGRLPFNSDSPMALVLMHIQEPVPKPSRFNPELPQAVERVILKAMAKEKKDRFESVTELQRAYKAALAGETVGWVEAPPEPQPVVQETPSRRRWPNWIMPAVALPALILVGVIAFPSLSQAIRGDQEPAVVLLESSDVPTPRPTLAAPTETVIPMTATPVQVAACPGLRLFGFSIEADEVSWTIDNGTSGPLRLVHVDPQWPNSEIQLLEEIWLGGSIWVDVLQAAGESESGVIEITIPEDERSLFEAGDLSQLMLKFGLVVVDSGYALKLQFDNGCLLETEW